MLQFRETVATVATTNIEELRRQTGLITLLVIGVVGIIYNTVTLIIDLSLTPTAITSTSYTAYTLSVIFLGLAFAIHRRVWVKLLLHVPIFMFLIVFTTLPSQLSFILLSITILLYSAIVANLPTYLFLAVYVAIWGLIQQQTLADFEYLPYTFIAISLSSIVFYVVDAFNRFAVQASRTNVLLQASSDIAQVINRELELQQLLDNTVNTIRDEFDFYHVQIFLVDERREYANLVASTGEAGKQLLARNHRLPIGSQSVIGRVSQVGTPVIAQNTGSDTVHALNELLPDTRAELAVPIIDSNLVVGALDIQSVNADAFQPNDIQALQIISNQLSVAVRNARLFEQAQQNIQENKQLLLEYEMNLRQVDRLNRTLTKQSWDNYLNQAYVDGVTLAGQRILPEAEWSDTMQAATAKQQTHMDINDEKQFVAVPIILRDQVLGAIEVEMDADANIADSIEMIQAVSQRLAVSLESARLFEETQEATLQEQQINEIVSSYETAVTIDELLQVTLERLQQALGAEKGTVRLGTVKSNTSSHHLHNGNGGSPS